MKEENYQNKLKAYLSRPKYSKKYTLREKVLCFLNEHPEQWFYVWEVERQQCQLGYISHKADNELSKLVKDKLIDSRDIGKFVVYSCK